jgi:hypothetical protein
MLTIFGSQRHIENTDGPKLLWLRLILKRLAVLIRPLLMLLLSRLIESPHQLRIQTRVTIVRNQSIALKVQPILLLDHGWREEEAPICSHDSHQTLPLAEGYMYK